MAESRNLENNLVRIIAVMAFLIFAYFGIRIFIGGIYTDKLIESYSGSAKLMENQFKEQIAAETDAYQAARMGTSFLKSQKDELALIAFQKATDLDAGYRDGWVGRGYAELKNNQPAEALKSLKKAEEIDPINPQTYELLAIAYQQTDDEEAAKKAQEKWEYLLKNK